MLSAKPIPARERLIVALDVETPQRAKQIVESLGDAVHFYKLGLQLFMADGYRALLDWMHAQGKKTFADLKFFDVPNTVASAMKQLRDSPAAFVTIHGNDSIMRAACEAKGEGGLKILAVTVLTSLDQGDMEDLGFKAEIKDVVLSRAKRAMAIGCDGVISSGLEAKELRASLGDKLLIVSPGIRPVENREEDDQKRIVTVPQAFENGADYIVVGRPILKAEHPKAAAERIQAEIARLFAA